MLYKPPKFRQKLISYIHDVRKAEYNNCVNVESEYLITITLCTLLHNGHYYHVYLH